MLYLISGAPRSGKTIIARRLLEKYSIPRLSTDMFLSMFQEAAPELGISFGKSAIDTFEEAFIKTAEKLWKYLRPALVYFLNEESDYLLEGASILPKQIKELQTSYPGIIRACLIGFTSADLTRKLKEVRSHAGIQGETDWTNERSDESLLRSLQKGQQYSRYLEQESLVHQIPYVDTSHNFQISIEKAINVLVPDRTK